MFGHRQINSFDGYIEIIGNAFGDFRNSFAIDLEANGGGEIHLSIILHGEAARQFRFALNLQRQDIGCLDRVATFEFAKWRYRDPAERRISLDR